MIPKIFPPGSNQRLSENFRAGEFRCRVRPDETTPPIIICMDLVYALEALRKAVGDMPLIITSGYRTVAHNARLLPPGSPTSLHLIGAAADVRPPDGMSPDGLAVAAATVPEFDMGGIGIYRRHVHLDIRDDGPARWRG